MNKPNSIAFLFPGQGSQSVGMGKELAEHHAVARQAFEEALAICRGLAQKDPEAHLPYVAVTLRALGTLDNTQNRNTGIP